MSAKSRNKKTRKKTYTLEQYIKAGLSITQAKAWRRQKFSLPMVVKPKETAPGAPIEEITKPVTQKERSANWYKRNRQLAINRAAARRLANPEATSAYMTRYYRYNKATLDAARSEWDKQNPGKVKKSKAKYVKNNPGKVNAKTAKRRAELLQRTPGWLTEMQKTEIEQFYVDAAALSWLSDSPLEVDHMIPLKGRNISGLHVPENLQILPKTLNRKKGNKWPSSI